MNNNAAPTLPNGNAPANPDKPELTLKQKQMLARKKRAADPFAPRRPMIKKPPRPIPRENLPVDKDGLRQLTGITDGPAVPKMASARDDKAMADFEKARAANGGWSKPLPPNAQNHSDFPLYTTKREIKEAMAFHIMKLNKPFKEGVEHDIDPTDQNQFTRPVSLHRRDARQPASGRAIKDDAEEEPTPDEAEAEKQAQLKAEKDAQRAIDRAQIAPSLNKDGKKPVAKKDKPFVNGGVKSSKIDPSRQELRYAEALPWHLEDADGKNVWVGSYVEALSNIHVALVVQGAGFSMIPLDKYYRFNSKPVFNHYSIEEAEKLMGKKAPQGRWAMILKKAEEKENKKNELKETRMDLGVGRGGIKGESATSRARNASERYGREELDLEGDGAFSDDDDQHGFDPDNDEDAKEAKERVRNDHLGANLFGEADEKEVEKQENEEDKEKQLRDEHGRHLRKALIKLEGHGDYLEEDDEFETSDEEEEKKDEAKPDENKDKDKPEGDAAAAAAASADKKPTIVDKKGKSLKRPGSPNLSESSGNESSRKKKLKSGNALSVRGSRAGTPSLSRKAGGAASDGEGTAGEMSDSGIKRKLKSNLGVGTGPRGTPSGSRAGSPAPSGAARAASPGSPLGSPAKSPTDPAEDLTITAQEIIDAVKPYGDKGVSIGELTKKFRGRIGEKPGQMTKKGWVSVVRAAVRVGAGGILHLKP